ncbi:MAG: methyltransferase [Magnetococcales bacterium]|nr:methyltransferase [Magnetococcales bacterium]
MANDARSIRRFLSAIPAHCPVDSLDYLHLLNWPASLPHPLEFLTEHGFSGTLSAGRISVAQQAEPYLNRLSTIVVSDHPSDNKPSNGTLLELPQGRTAALMTIQAGLDALTPNARLWLFGNRDTGIMRIAKSFSNVETVFYKGHYRLLSLSTESQCLDTGFEEQRKKLAKSDFFHHMTVKGLSLATLPGTFSWQEPDSASLMLLETIQAQQEIKGPVLDWGCGCGLLGLSLAMTDQQLEVTLADDQWSAIRSTERAIQLNDQLGLSERCTVIAENGIGPKLSGSRFRTVITNPPFHRGNRMDRETTNLFIQQVSSAMHLKGTLWLVGNQFLNYTPLLEAAFKVVSKPAENERFCVWQAQGVRLNKSRY